MLACGLTLASVLCSAATAEELIFDPENPAIDEKSGESDDSSDTESIVDPENAGFDEPADDQYEKPAPTPSVDAPTAVFLGTYSTESRLDTHFSNHELIFEQHNQLNLRVELDEGSQFRAVVEGQFEHWWGFEKGASDGVAAHDAQLRDGYVVYRDGPWTLAAGNQIISWGATDIFRPGDVINPIDATDLSFSGRLERVHQLTLDATYATSTFSVQGVFVPFFRPNRLWVYGRDTAIFGRGSSPQSDALIQVLDRVIDPSRIEDVQPLLLSTSEPDEGPQSFSGGVRATWTVANADIGMSYFFGWDRTPAVQLDEDARDVLTALAEDETVLDDFDILGFLGRNSDVAPAFQNLQDKAARSETLFEASYRRQHTLAVDFTRLFGPIGVRADVAMQSARTFPTSDFSTVRRPALSGALGLSYERLVDESDALVLSLEGLVIHAFDANASLTELFVPGAERGDETSEFMLFEDTTFVAAAAASWTAPVGLQFQAGGFALPQRDVWLVGGGISRQWSAAFTTGLTAMYFGNSSDDDSFNPRLLSAENDYIGLRISGLF